MATEFRYSVPRPYMEVFIGLYTREASGGAYERPSDSMYTLESSEIRETVSQSWLSHLQACIEDKIE